MLKVRRLELLAVEIPFRASFRHSRAERSRTDSVVVRATGEDGAVGHGECAPRPYVSAENRESVWTAIDPDAGGLARPFLGRAFASFDSVVAALQGQLEDLPRDRHAAFCAVELALLDLAGRTFGESAGSVLGPIVATEVGYDGAAPSDPAAATPALEAARKLQLQRVKLKVGASRQQDLALLARARDILGPECGLRADANGAWTADEALECIEAFAPYRLNAIEQPVAADDLEGLALVASRSPLPVIADESLVSLDDAVTLIERRACHGLNIRVSKCGGLVNSGRIRDLAQDAGLFVQVGAHVGETAILTAAGRQLATRTKSLRFLEGSFGRLLLEEDVATEDLTFGVRGRAPALQGAGLGIAVSGEKLDRHVLMRRELR